MLVEVIDIFSDPAFGGPWEADSRSSPGAGHIRTGRRRQR